MALEFPTITAENSNLIFTGGVLRSTAPIEAPQITVTVQEKQIVLTGASNLHETALQGNVTSNTLIFDGGFVSGRNPDIITIESSNLNIDLAGLSYRTFSCHTGSASNLANINITNDIFGSQGVVYLTAGDDIRIHGANIALGGNNVNVSYDDLILTQGQRAIIGFTSDGSQRYINAIKYPFSGTSGASFNLRNVTTNGGTTDQDIVSTANITANRHFTTNPTAISVGRTSDGVLNTNGKVVLDTSYYKNDFTQSTGFDEITVPYDGTYEIICTVNPQMVEFSTLHFGNDSIATKTQVVSVIKNLSKGNNVYLVITGTGIETNGSSITIKRL